MRTVHRSTPWLGALACLLCLASRSAPAAQLEAPGRAVAVTVFRDRAEIEREVEVNLPVGLSRVTFVGLPPGLERDSLRASVTGPTVVLGAVEVVDGVASPEESPEVQALLARLAKLRAERATLRARDESSGEQQKFLRAVAEHAAQPRPENASLDIGRIDAFYRLMGARLEELSDATLARDERRAALAVQIELEEGRLAGLQRDASIQELRVAVEVEAESAGARTLRLQYVLQGASWQPTYRATFDPATGEVSLISEAVVTQRSGEDWDDVSLRLSTATPARGLAPVQLAGLWLRRPAIEEITVSARKREESLQDTPVAVTAFSEADLKDMDIESITEISERVPSLQFDQGPRRETEVGRPANTDVARDMDVERAEHTVTFRVPGRSSIAADGRAHRVPLRRATLRAALEHRIVPAASESAYVIAHAQAPDYPLLAGALRAYTTGTYLGSFALGETPAGEKLDLPFGVDDRVRVDRTRAPTRESSSGLLSRQRQVEYRFATRIENTTAETRTIVVEDRLPISEDDRIEVDLADATSAGWRTLGSRPGILEWPLELEPGEKREIVFGYTVRFPEGVSMPRL